MPPQCDPDDATLTDEHSSSAARQEAVAESDLVGTMVGGRYLVERVLGRGGIGVVYLARDKPEMMSRRVVVKVLLKDSLKSERIIQKFHQEIESLTRLDDPGVVGIFDAGSLPDGAPFLVMQYVDGSSLRAGGLRPGGMDFERAANIIRGIGRTLTAAHDKGIIHRDLKPENIMLQRMTGGEEQVKVIDFGIAKVKDSLIAPSTVTGIGVAGTIGYMSPEQLKGQRVTPASDVYALGVIAYEMLTGIRPFNPETAFQLLEMQREGVRVRPKDLRPALPEAAQEVLLKALAFETRDRYQQAREFGDAMARALFDEPDKSEPSTFERYAEKNTRSDANPESPEKFKERKQPRLSIPFVVAILLVGVLMTALALWILRGQGEKETKTTEPQVSAASGRSLNYSLTVQKMTNKKPVGGEIESTGQELYGNGWKFRLNITPAQSGALYLLNEGPGQGGTQVYNVLFPTPKNNGGEVYLSANQKLQTGWYFFDENTGTEKLWIIWTEHPLVELDVIFKNAVSHELVISDPDQINTVRELLAHYSASKPEVETNKSEKRTTLKGKGPVLVSLLELEHNQY